MNFDCFWSKIVFTFQFMASESSLLHRWHPAYQPLASGIPLKMTRHPAYQKGGFHPQLVKCDSKGCLWFKLHIECFNVEHDCYFCVCYIPPDNSPVYKNVNSEHFEYDLFQILNDEIVTYSCWFLGFFFSVRLLSVLRDHLVFSSPPQRPMTSDFEGFLYQILSIRLFSYLTFWERASISLLNVEC